jgi:hypothetical protein
MIVCAGLAQVEFFDLIFAEDLGYVQGRGIVTFLAFHGRASPKINPPRGNLTPF